MARREVAFDAFQARAGTATAKDFARRFGLQVTCRFSLAMYGSLACSTMCEYWVQKMTWFFNLWEGSGSEEGYVFDRNDVRAFEEPTEFSELAAGAKGHLARRIGELRDMVPAAR